MRTVTFHHLPVREGNAIHLQDNEQVMSVEYDAEVSLFYAVVMSVIDGEPDSGAAADNGGSGGV